MIRRAAARLLHWLAGLVAVLALAAGFLVWRLSAGPISLDALTPYVAQSIAAAESGLVAHVDHTFLTLAPGPSIEIVAQGVHLARSDGGAELALPELAMAFSPRAALRGVAAPTRVVLSGPELRLVRAADGTFHLGLGEASTEAGDWRDTLLHDIAAAPDRRGTLGFLSDVSIRRAALTVDDRALGVVWHAAHADATLHRDARGISGTLALTAVAPGGTEADLRGRIDYARAANRLSVEVSFGALKPSLFAGAAPALAPLAAVDLPVSGRVRFEFDPASLRIGAAECVLLLGGGSLVHPALEGGRVAIASGALRAAYDPAKGRIAVDKLTLDLGGPGVELAGTIDGVGDNVLAGGWPQAIDFAGNLHLSNVPADALPGLWPEGLSPHSRDWVTEHIHDGIVPEAAARFAGHADLTSGAAKPVRIDTLDGTLAYRGLTVEYFKPLEPLRGVDGTATFDRTQLILTPSSGSVKGVKLAGGTARLFQLDTNDEQIAIAFGIKGPIRDVLDVLNEKPLEYARALNIDPAQVTGQVDGQLNFAFPLKHDLTLDMVDFGAAARLSGVGIGQVMAGRDLSDGDLQLKLDRNALSLDGAARLDGVPSTLSWTQSLKQGGPPPRYTVAARLDEAARQKLGLDVPVGMLSGPIGVNATYTLLSPKRASATVAFDFVDAALALDRLGWKKPAGVPGTATLGLDLVDGHIRAVRQAAFSGGGLDATLDATLDAGGKVLRVDVPHLAVGATDVAATVTRRDDGGWRVEVKGKSFDATELVKKADRSPNDNETEPPLFIDATLDRLILGPKRETGPIKGQLFSDGVHWQAMSIDAALGGKGKFSLRFGEAGGDRGFRLATDDLGATLRVLDVSDNVEGGRVEIVGRAEDSGSKRTFRGKLDGVDYRIVQAPILARLLSVASLSGASALLSGQGIPFTRLSGQFSLTDGKLEVKELRAYGGALGIKADGVYDFAGNTLDISGTLVPAYTINSVLGNIPLLGPLITGGQGEGIFAANFRVAGAADDPKVTLNPLSALAPGVLRKLFLFEAPEPAKSTPQPAEPKPSGDTPR